MTSEVLETRLDVPVLRQPTKNAHGTALTAIPRELRHLDVAARGVRDGDAHGHAGQHDGGRDEDGPREAEHRLLVADADVAQGELLDQVAGVAQLLDDLARVAENRVAHLRRHVGGGAIGTRHAFVACALAASTTRRRSTARVRSSSHQKIV